MGWVTIFTSADETLASHYWFFFGVNDALALSKQQPFACNTFYEQQLEVRLALIHSKVRKCLSNVWPRAAEEVQKGPSLVSSTRKAAKSHRGPGIILSWWKFWPFIYSSRCQNFPNCVLPSDPRAARLWPHSASVSLQRCCCCIQRLSEVTLFNQTLKYAKYSLLSALNFLLSQTQRPRIRISAFVIPTRAGPSQIS